MENGKVNNSRYILKPAHTTWISIVLMISIGPLGIVLPNWWGWENGPIEWTQVVILVLSLVFCLFMAWDTRNDNQFSRIWGLSTIAWLLIIGRELSWGRVFFPVENGCSEPEFISLQQLYYGEYVNPAIAVMIIAMIIGLWRTGNFKYFLKTIPISIIDVTIVVFMTVLATIFEKGIIKMLAQRNEVLEELSELVIYWAMFSIVYIVAQKGHMTIVRLTDSRQMDESSNHMHS